MLEVHQQGRSVFWSGVRERAEFLRAAAARLSAAGHAGTNELMEICRQNGHARNFRARSISGRVAAADSREHETGRRRAAARAHLQRAGRGERKRILRGMETLRRAGTAPAFPDRDRNRRRDLRQLNGDNEKTFANCTLRIPIEHAEAWLNALNQARLVIAAKFGFTEGSSAIIIVRRSVRGAISACSR